METFHTGERAPSTRMYTFVGHWKVAHVASDKMKKTYPCPLEKHFHLV